MVNAAVKAVKGVDAVCSQLREGKISPDDAAAQVEKLGPLALNPLISNASCAPPGKGVLELLDRIGGKPAVAAAIGNMLDAASEAYRDNQLGGGRKEPFEFVKNICQLGQCAVPALLEQLCGENHIFAAPMLVNMGYGAEARRAIVQLLREGGDRAIWTPRLVELNRLIAGREIFQDGIPPRGADLNGLKLAKLFRSGKFRGVPAGKSRAQSFRRQNSG